jgi:hypothetical protein
MKKIEAVKLLVSEGWTKADAIRALEILDFNNEPDELTIRRMISSFAGSELTNRQRFQAAQKGLVTKKQKEIQQKEQEYQAIITRLKNFDNQEKESIKVEQLIARNNTLQTQNQQLIKVNQELQKDNKSLKNIIDAIKLKLAIDTNKLIKLKDSEIRQALVKLFNSTLG